MKTQMFRNFARRGLFAVALGVLALVGFVGTGQAQTGSGSPPPTYDWDNSVPGVQQPTSPLVANPDFRSVRLYQVAFPVLVPLAELQGIMPAGFTAIATPAGSQTGTVNFLYIVDQRFERPTLGQTYGPFTGILVTTNAVNNNVSPARTELVFPAFEVSSEVDALNAVFGPGSARLAKVKMKVVEKDGTIRFDFDVKDKSLGFHVEAGAEAPVTINTRTKSDPIGIALRAFNGFTPNRAVRAASISDFLAVPTASANATFETEDGQLHFPAGNLTILGLGPNITFSRNVEFVIKFE